MCINMSSKNNNILFCSTWQDRGVQNRKQDKVEEKRQRDITKNITCNITYKQQNIMAQDLNYKIEA